MMSESIPIVVVAFNRARSLKRLLKSIARANYPTSDISLIISIDKSNDNNDVLEVANNFIWHFGTKEVRYSLKNLGLRQHILQCGDLSSQYGSVIVLEDDLYVSENYYTYTLAALKFAQNKDDIAGISLYNHQLNVHNREIFSAIEDGYDNWYFQFASSWGQAWSSAQWKGFKNWYQNNSKFTPNDDIPLNVSSWSDKSWLKFYIAYLIEKKKYFLYPKTSLATNFSDAGTHVGKDSTSFQVPLDFSHKEEYEFSSPKNSKAVYDAFFENQNLHQVFNLKKEEICIDLYGYRSLNDTRFLLTSKILNFKILNSYGKSLKPIDTNIIEGIQGNELFLYDTSIFKKNHLKVNSQRKLIYNIKHISLSNALKMAYFIFLERLKSKLNQK